VRDRDRLGNRKLDSQVPAHPAAGGNTALKELCFASCGVLERASEVGRHPCYARRREVLPVPQAFPLGGPNLDDVAEVVASPPLKPLLPFFYAQLPAIRA
jgi:hypothetical protein